MEVSNYNPKDPLSESFSLTPQGVSLTIQVKAVLKWPLKYYAVLGSSFQSFHFYTFYYQLYNKAASTPCNNLLPFFVQSHSLGGETGDFPAIQPLHSRIQLNHMSTADKLWNKASGSDLATIKRLEVKAHILCRLGRSWWYQVP